MKTRLALAVVASLLAAPALADVTVTDAWVRGTVPAQKATGAFKKELWGMSEADRAHVRNTLEARFAMLYNRLGVENTHRFVEQSVNVREVHKRPEDFGVIQVVAEDVSGLAD